MRFSAFKFLFEILSLKRTCRFNALTILFPMYYTAKHLGLMPFRVVPVDRLDSRGAQIHKLNHKRAFKFELCRLGICFSVIQFGIRIWAIVECLKYITSTLMDLSVTPAVICTTGNYCSVFGILFMHIFVSFLIMLMLPFRLRETGAILNETELLLTKYYKNRSRGYDVPWPTLILFSFVGMSYFSAIYYLHYNKNRVLFWLFSYVKVSSNVLINVVVILSVVAEKSYEMINQQLRDLAAHRPEDGQRSQCLEQLMVLHWFVTDYVEHISHCFGVELCIIMMEIYAQLIIRMFVTSYVLFLHGLFPLSLDHQLVGVFDLLSVTTNLSYLCYRCDRVVFKGSQSQLFLQDICIQNNLDKHSKEVIHLFMMRLNCRKIVVDGYGFFTINLAQLVKIIGVVLTYFVVLVQFQTDNNSNEQENKFNKTDANACEWPCVQF